MARSGKRPWWALGFAVLLLVMAARYFVMARNAAASHTLAFLPDRLGGLGDTWMWPGQAYFFSALAGIAALWLLIRFFRRRA